MDWSLLGLNSYTELSRNYAKPTRNKLIDETRRVSYCHQENKGEESKMNQNGFTVFSFFSRIFIFWCMMHLEMQLWNTSVFCSVTSADRHVSAFFWFHPISLPVPFSFPLGRGDFVVAFSSFFAPEDFDFFDGILLQVNATVKLVMALKQLIWSILLDTEKNYRTDLNIYVTWISICMEHISLFSFISMNINLKFFEESHALVQPLLSRLSWINYNSEPNHDVFVTPCYCAFYILFTKLGLMKKISRQPYRGRTSTLIIFIIGKKRHLKNT